MGYTALHADWGRLDASLDDLGCGRSWPDVHRVKGLELACPECRGRVFARVSPHRARHFYHQVRPHDCALANESPEHHLLKLEVGNEARTWRADVLVFDGQDRPFMALEAQLSPMTPQDARMRTDRYAADGVAVCWASMEKRPWERGVPSLRVAPPRNRGDAWTVRHGMARYTWAAPHTLKTKAAWTHISCSLEDAIRWILQGRVHARTGPDATVWWTPTPTSNWPSFGPGWRPMPKPSYRRPPSSNADKPHSNGPLPPNSAGWLPRTVGWPRRNRRGNSGRSRSG